VTHALEINEGRTGSRHVPRSVGWGAEAVIGARSDSRRIRAVFERSAVPMVMVDSNRRYVDVNRPARLWFRRSVDEMRNYAMEDLAPADQVVSIARNWARLLDAGSLAGHYLAANPDGSRVETIYFAIADVLPGLHVTVFAPADWPEDEFAPVHDEHSGSVCSLTQREIEVLALAADGLSGPELADHLTLSPATIKTHFKNIYLKLDVKSRAGAVAKAMRLGVID
jgi:DNA-binding CsgD family transcriptional regulator